MAQNILISDWSLGTRVISDWSLGTLLISHWEQQLMQAKSARFAHQLCID